MTLLESIVERLETRQSAGRRTTLHKIRAHINIRGKDLADAAPKLAVRSFDTLPTNQTLRVDIGEIAPRQHYCIMYTATPLPLNVALNTLTRPASTIRAWWIIPEEERL